MISVNFYESVEDDLLEFAVIISRANNKWVYCKHKARDTYEVPGGHRELGENILDTAKRELYEETGALDFEIKPVCAYSVIKEMGLDKEETFGMLYFADISEFEGELHSEIEKIILVEEMVDAWTYPEIQPKLMEEARRRNFI